MNREGLPLAYIMPSGEPGYLTGRAKQAWALCVKERESLPSAVCSSPAPGNRTSCFLPLLSASVRCPVQYSAYTAITSR